MSEYKGKTSDATKLLAKIYSHPRGVEYVYKRMGWDSERFNKALNELLVNEFVEVIMLAKVLAVRRTTPKVDPHAEFERINGIANSLSALIEKKGYKMQNIRDVYERWLYKEDKLHCTETWCDVTAGLLLLLSRGLIDCSGVDVCLPVPAVKWEEPSVTKTTGYIKVKDAE